TGRITAVARHPKNPELVAAADSEGTFKLHPRNEATPRWSYSLGASIVSLTFSPDGGRLAATSADGKVVILDHQRMGKVLTFQSSAGGITDLLFDAGGRRLALIHDDGLIEIWETEPANLSPISNQAGKWRQRSLLDSDEARFVQTRPEAVGVDPTGNIRV